MHHKIFTKIYGLTPSLLAILPLLLIIFVPSLAHAQTFMPDGTCSNDPQFDIVPQYGIISAIVNNIANILNSIAGSMYLGIVGNSGFINAVRVAVTIYVAVYGMLFTFGMVQITLYDFVIRLIKISILTTLIAPNSWGFFFYTVVNFFNGGTDELISVVTSISVGNAPTGNPFVTLDWAIAMATSAKMAVTLLAIFGTGPYGFFIGILLVMSLGSFLKSLVQAMWVYLMSLTLKTLLFGLAPIFIACLLFTRTKHIFDGWLNQVVNASLQPILLFAFFSFFSALVHQSIYNLLQRPVCWTEWAESLRGSPFSEHFWRFTDQYGAPYGGTWSFTGSQTGEIFPIDIISVLILLILAELAGRFNHVVIEVARDLAGAATNLSGMHGAFGGGSGGGLGGSGGSGGKSGGGLLGGLFGDSSKTSTSGGSTSTTGGGTTATSQQASTQAQAQTGVRPTPKS